MALLQIGGPIHPCRDLLLRTDMNGDCLFDTSDLGMRTKTICSIPSNRVVESALGLPTVARFNDLDCPSVQGSIGGAACVILWAVSFVIFSAPDIDIAHFTRALY